MNSIKSNIYLKLLTIAIIGLILLIPATMIEGLICERESTQKDAIKEVGAKWGDKQTVTGPYISIPYTRNSATEFLHIAPSELNIKGNITPEPRYRGIYEIVVYNSKLNLSGSFKNIDVSNLGIPLDDIQFDQARLVIGINDLRGLEKQVNLTWNNTTHLFYPGTVSSDIVSSGINSSIKFDNNSSSAYSFSIDLDLNGSQFLHFIPSGEVTDVELASTWDNPSFMGAFLPDSRSITANGFNAHWNVLQLNRNLPQAWRGTINNTNDYAFGIDLLLPVDNYQKSIRSIKYAILFIAFTFLVFFFVEVSKKVFIHPIQYLLVGIALIVFYTLLLSISEHLSYNSAFVISASSTILLITGYIKAILKSNILTLMISGLLVVLYSFIFVIIQLQDYSLLIGSVGIFMILSFLMFFSRKIDWYNITSEQRKCGLKTEFDYEADIIS
jgi:inner membrane protein